MTDKQIIDLTEIEQKYKDKCSLIKAGKCKNVNIFIEQSRKLKAKEQECEHWKHQAELGSDTTDRLAKELEEKEQECERLRFPMPDTNYAILTKEEFEQLDQLKADNDKLKTYITSFDYLDALSNEQVAVLYTACIDELAIRGYGATYKSAASLLTRYHNALTEIKEYCTDMKKDHYWGMRMMRFANEILQIISECEVDNE